MEEELQKIAALEQRIAAIEERNRRVEAEKTWETSAARKLSILALTYFVMCLVFRALNSEPFWANAVVPTLGFFLSTLSLPVLKKRWSESQASKQAALNRVGALEPLPAHGIAVCLNTSERVWKAM